MRRHFTYHGIDVIGSKPQSLTYGIDTFLFLSVNHSVSHGDVYQKGKNRKKISGIAAIHLFQHLDVIIRHVGLAFTLIESMNTVFSVRRCQLLNYLFGIIDFVSGDYVITSGDIADKPHYRLRNGQIVGVHSLIAVAIAVPP